MKNSVLVIIGVLMSASIYAQTDSSKINKMPVEEMPIAKPIDVMNNKDSEQNRNWNDSINRQNVLSQKQDKVFMEGKKMMLLENGIVSELKHEIKMKDGTRVYTNGVYVLLNGTKMVFKNGDQMTMDGVLTQLK